MNRSILFIPGHKLDFFYKLEKPFADILVIDLEDSVPKDKKIEALNKVKKFFKTNQTKKNNFFIRVDHEEKNFFTTMKDLINNKITGFILPKIKYKEEVSKFVRFLDKEEKKKKIKKRFKLSIIIETVDAILNLSDIVKSSNRIDTIIYGEEDFHAEFNNINFSDELSNNYTRNLIPIIAKSNNIDAIYTPFLYLKDKKGLKNHILKSIKLGYSGLLLIHPNQICLANKLYYPSKKDFMIANEILRSNKAKKYEGQSISVLKNKLVGPPMIKRAQRIIKKNKIKQ